MKKLFKNHLGFSLIEMITAFAVLGIATLAIGGFFVSSSRSYAGTSSETSIQYEAQMALNQIEGKLIDATLGVNYNLVENENDVSKYNFVESDTIANDALKSKVLYIFDSKDAGFKVLLIKWDIAGKQLLYKEVSLNNFAQNDTVKGLNIKGTSTADGWELLAEGVTNFSVDLSKYKETKAVDVTIELEKRDKTFETTGTITLRNNVLVNASNISDIYKNMSGATATRIDGVVLSANTDVTTPSGTVQLSTTVTGVYPSQDIHKWIVAHTYDALNGANEDILDEDDMIPTAESYVDSQKILHVSSASLDDATFHQTLYVQAVVNPDTTPVYSNIITINVRAITGLAIWPTADLNAVGNENLTAETVESWGSVANGGINSTTANIYPSNKIQMNSTIAGQYQDSDDVKVSWTIAQKDSGVVATINEETGLITVDRNSQMGMLKVKASLQGTSYSAEYAFAVVSPYSNGATVTVTAPTQMNRGQDAYQCQVKLNGATAYASDFNWSVEVETSSGQPVTGNPVEISSTGLLTIKDTLSFDYSYKVTVYARLKSDPSIYGPAIINVPKVTMFLSTTEALTPRIGSTIPAGKIICNVVGLENYDVDWSIAKETNPTYYFTAYGNTNITGNQVTLYPNTENERVAKTPKVVIGADEPQTLTYMRVKATLKGHSNYSATLKLVFNETIGGDTPNNPTVPETPTTPEKPTTPTVGTLPNTNNDKYSISGGSVSRNGSVTVMASRRYWDSRYYRYRTDDVVVDRNSWTITRVTVGGQEIENYEGVSIVSGNSNAVIRVDATFMLNNWDKDIKVFINATKDGKKFESDAVVTVDEIRLSFTEGANTISYGRSQTYKCQLEGFSNVDGLLNNRTISLVWDLENESEDITLGTPTNNGKNVKVSVANRDFWQQRDVNFKVKVSLQSQGNTYITRDYAVKADSWW